jgi:histidine triad (HIT) family protein
MSRDPNCLFCKIVAGEIPSTRVLETDRAVVILDINPVVQGHLLIIPRDHHVQLLDLPDDLAAHAGSLLPRLARAVAAAVGAEGSNTVINSGRVAGQEIDHCHWHLIPRHQGDPVRWAWPRVPCTGDELARTASRIIAELT